MSDVKSNDLRQCFTCLSIGRKMIKFGDLYKIFRKLVRESWVMNTTEGSPQGLLCWECHAELVKMQQFLHRVKKAHSILKTGEQLLHGSLSNLTTVTINDAHNTVYLIEQPDKQTVKAEAYDNHELNNTFDNFENDSELVKLENVLQPEIKNAFKTNNWARKRALINKKPKFRILTHLSIDKIFKNITITKKSACKLCCLDLSYEHCRKKVSKTYLCDVCKKLFTHKHHLVSHLRSHSMFVCKLCELSFVEGDRVKHLQSKHRRALQCVKCGLVFGKRREFFKHYKHWHETYICDYCGVSFKMKYCIENHIKKQHRSFECKPCGKSFSRYSSLWLHKKMHHTPLLPAFCVECNTHYPDTYRYRWHLANSVKHKPPRKNRYPCTHCDKVFSKKIHMTDHHNFVHLKHFKYRCQDCNKNYIRNAELQKHRRRVHDGVLPPKDKICSTCGRGFTTNKILMNHVRIHTGERPFACQKCPAKFTQSAALLTHTRALHPE